MAPRARLLRRRAAATLAARPRPKDPLLLTPPWERPPAFCAALRACARKDFAFGALVDRIRPGRMRKSSLRLILPTARCRKLRKNRVLAKLARCASSSQ